MRTESLGQRASPSPRGEEADNKWPDCCHASHGLVPGLFLAAGMLHSWILVILKPPSYLHVLPYHIKPYGMTVAELLTALLPILSQLLQNTLPWPSLPLLQLSQLRNSRGRRWGSSVMYHEDIS